MRHTILFLLVALLALPAVAQQIADTSFKANVGAPAYPAAADPSC